MMEILLILLVALLGYILFWPDNWLSKQLDQVYGLDDDILSEMNPPFKIPTAPDKLEPQYEEECPLKPKPKKKRVTKRKRVTTKRKPKPRKPRKSNNK
jgi:hypothetical protein